MFGYLDSVLISSAEGADPLYGIAELVACHAASTSSRLRALDRQPASGGKPVLVIDGGRLAGIATPFDLL